MKEIPVDKITIRNIAETCGTTRQTFYRNFQDKYELINWYFDKMVQESLAQISDAKMIQASLRQKFEFIKKERIFFTGAFKSDDYNSLKEHDFELFLDYYKKVLEKELGHKMTSEQFMQLEMFCRGALYMTTQWILSGMKMPPEEIARIVADALPTKLAEILP